jgi:hypothetical protein
VSCFAAVCLALFLYTWRFLRIEDQVGLNTLHVAFTGKQATTELAPGVNLKSYPVVGKEPPDKSLERTRGR